MYVLVLNIDIPRHSYFYNFYPALHFVSISTMSRPGVVNGLVSGHVYMYTPDWKNVVVWKV